MRQEVYVKFAEALTKKAGELKRDAVVKQAERVDTFLRSVGVVHREAGRAGRSGRRVSEEHRSPRSMI